jgi:hypothetical protein
MCDRGVLSKSNYVDARVLSQAPNDTPRELPEGFHPGPRDVICSRGADCFNNPGNKYFRSKLGEHLEEYSRAPNKMKKGIIVSSIIDEIREHGGAFVRQDTGSGRWFEVGDRLAREKTGQALRSALRKSSPTSFPAAKSAMRKCDSPMSLKSAGSGSSRATSAHNPNPFGDELFASDRSLRTTASPKAFQLPTTLAALTSSGPERRGGRSSLVKHHSSRTWSGGDKPHDKALEAVPPTSLRRSLTDPSQLDPDDMSFVLPPTFLEERESSVFGAHLPLPLPPPPPPTADLQRQVSTWSSVIARLPGLLDYDPYPASQGAAVAATAAEPGMLRRESSFDFYFGAHSHSSAAPGSLGVPLEIRIDLGPDDRRRWAGPIHNTGMDDEDNDDDIDLGDWES